MLKKLLLLTIISTVIWLSPEFKVFAEEPGPEYLSETVECRFTPELQALAQQLDHNPVKIYNWVYENIEYESYWYSQKNAQATYLTKRGNDWDQCSLLIALLRISGIYARYVSDNSPGSFGFPYVEVWANTENYRGINNGGGKTWLPLKPSYKQYKIDEGIDLFPNGSIPTGLNFDFNNYLTTIKQNTVLESFQVQIQAYLKDNYPGKSIKSVPYKKDVIKRTFSILPSTLPRDVYGPEQPSRDIPFFFSQRAYVAFKAGATTLLERFFNLSEVAARRFCLDFIPASTNDEQIIAGYGGMCNTPANAARVKPVLRLDGEIIQEGLPIYTGTYFTPVIGESSMSAKTRPAKLAGTFIQIGFDFYSSCQDIIQTLKTELKDISTETILTDSTREEYLGRLGQVLMMSFFDRFNQAYRQAMELTHCGSWFGPQCYTLIYTFPDNLNIDNESKYLVHPVWNIDAWLVNSSVSKIEGGSIPEDFKLFVQKLFAFTASYNEARVFEDLQDTPSVSTVKGIMIAYQQGIDVVTLTSADIAAGHLPMLENQTQDRLDDGVIQTIINELNDGQTVTIPVRKIHHEGMSFWVYASIGLEGIRLMFNYDHGGQSSEQVKLDENHETLQEYADNFGLDVNDVYVLLVDLDKDGVWDQEEEQALIEIKNLNIEAKKSLDGDPVDLVTGEFYHEEKPDFDIKSRAVKLDIVRKYKSKLIFNGPFGYGWAWNHAERLLIGNNGDLVFYNADCSPYYLTSNGDGTYHYPAGTTFTIEKAGSQYILARNDQSKLYFSDTGLLTKKEDSNGNALTFSYNSQDRLISITDSLNRSLTFNYNNQGKISQITDFKNRSCTYEYHGNDLFRFTDLEGNAYEYEYLQNQENPSCNHNMSKYILPNGDYLEIGYYKNDTTAYHTNKKGEIFNFSYSRLNKYAETWNEEGYYRKIFYNDNQDVVRVTTKEGTIELKQYDNQHNLTSYTDANGYTTTFTYDDNRNLTSQTNVLGQVRRYQYHPTFNKPIKIIDPNNNETLFSYDSAGNLISKTDALGNITSYTYDSYGNLMAITDPQSYTEEMTYDTNSLSIVEFKDKNTNIIRYGYDDIGNVVSITDPQNNSASFKYNNYNQKTKVTDALSYDTYYEYDSNRFLTRVIGADGAVTDNVYDTVRDVVSGAKIIKTIDPLGKSEIFDYDKLGNLISKTDKNGDTTCFEYDAMSRLIKTIDPFQNTIYNSYDANGNLIAIIDKRGNTTTFSYNAANQKISATDPLGNRTTYEYDNNGNLARETDALGLIIKYDYNALNQLITKTIGLGLANPRIYSYAYNSRGNLTKATDPLGNYMMFEYDGNGNKTKEKAYDLSDIILAETTFIYDSLNRLIQKTDAQGKIWQYEYDALGRKTADIDPLGNRVEYTYDKVGNLIKLKDQRNNITSFKYNLRKEKIAETNPLGYTTRFSYDSNGNPQTETDPDNKVTEYHYDALNRKIGETTPTGETIIFSYDENSNLASQQDTYGNVINYRYDANNNLLEQRDLLLPNTMLYSYSYNALGQIKECSYPYITSRDYNAFHEIDSISYRKTYSMIANYYHDDLGRISGLRYENASQITGYTYNNLNQLTNINNPHSSFQYTQDKLGNKLTMTKNGSLYNYSYDDTYQLTNTQYPDLTNETLAYDSTGNRITFTNPSLTTDYTSNQLNQYSSVEGTSYTYDKKGNLTNDSTWTYSYDYKNRLISATNGATTANYKYDALGNRIEKSIAGNGTIKYLYDNNHQVLAEYDSNNTCLRRYFYGEGIDNILMMEDVVNNQYYYYHKDALGSISEITNSNGNLIEKYEYTPFGKTTIKDSNDNILTESAIGNRFGFTGRELDCETGLYHYRARVFSPTLGRFLQTDPVGYQDDINLYRYVRNNPINYTDPLGLMVIEGRDDFGTFVKATFSASAPNFDPGLELDFTPELVISTIVTGVAAVPTATVAGIWIFKEAMPWIVTIQTLITPGPLNPNLKLSPGATSAVKQVLQGSATVIKEMVDKWMATKSWP